MLQFIQYLKGYVCIRVWGYSPERFMNLCSNHDILLWNIENHGECEENRDEGSHTKALWTAFFYAQDEAAENFPAGAYRKPGVLGMDVHLYLGGGYFRELFYFRGCFYGLSEGE